MLIVFHGCCFGIRSNMSFVDVETYVSWNTSPNECPIYQSINNAFKKNVGKCILREVLFNEEQDVSRI